MEVSTLRCKRNMQLKMANMATLYFVCAPPHQAVYSRDLKIDVILCVTKLIGKDLRHDQSNSHLMQNQCEICVPNS